jgi:hypothetical protein
MLSVVLERIRSSSLLPSMPQSSNLKSIVFDRLKHDFGKDYERKVTTCFDGGLRRLFEKVARECKTNSGRLTYSGTYGENDVLTLTWLTELLRFAVNDRDNVVGMAAQGAALRNPLRQAVKVLQRQTLEKAPASGRPLFRCILYRDRLKPQAQRKEIKNEALEHPFPLVRVVHLLASYHELFNGQPGKAQTRVSRLSEDELGG